MKFGLNTGLVCHTNIVVGDFLICSLKQKDAGLELRFQVMELIEENLW